MGWFSDAWKKVKKVFKKVTKVVKKVVKGVGNVAKKVWNGVKSTAKKFGEKISKLGPVANIAMGMIPGFGQLWTAYGVWGAMAKGAITGYLTSGGNVKGALLGAAGGGLGYGYSKLPGTSLSEKISNAFKLGEGTETLNKSFSNAYKNLAKDYTGRIGADTSNIPPSMRGQYKYSAPSVDSIQGAYQANIDRGMTNEAIMKSFNDQAARDAAWWKANPEPATTGDKIAEGLSNWAKSQSNAQKGYEVPTAIADTSSLNQYPIQAMGTKGEVGTGLDPNEQLIKQLGLTTLRDQSILAKQQYAT